MGEIIFYAFLALIVVLGVVYRSRLSAFGFATKKFLREVRVEMQKVAWPTKNDVIGSTVIVLVAVVLLTIIVAATDGVLSVILDFILQQKGA